MDEVPPLQLDAILRTDPVRWRLLEVVSYLGLPDCWIAAGFIRTAVWDTLHGRPAQPPIGDVDVIWFDPDRAEEAHDRNAEAALRALAPSVHWSVKNQSRMHVRNGDLPYRSATDAMRYRPETATAVAAGRSGSGQIETASPLGLHDLFNPVLRPTPRFVGEKRPIFDARVRTKAWLTAWPLLKQAEPLSEEIK